GSEDGQTWDGWEDPPPFPGADETAPQTTYNFTVNKRYLQFKANLAGSAVESPILASAEVYNVAGRGIDASPYTVTVSSQDDWEAGLVGTTSDLGKYVPNVNVRKRPGTVFLASSA
ncbi:MAG: hypothetical protein COS84_04565, partial [Armatimonadetes bacterium CG07_land_8_20_14_0_80_40_9]